MKLLYDFFPIVLFFLSFKLYGMYTATVVAIVASFAQVIFYRIRHQSFDKMQLISLALMTVLGGATLIFQNPLFFKWKPTAIYWVSALIFVGSTLMSKKPIIQRMLEANIQLPEKIWSRLNHAWGVFFTLLGGFNLFVAYHFDTNTWVNFKLFGATGLTLSFVIIQALYLAKHVTEPSPQTERNNATASR